MPGETGPDAAGACPGATGGPLSSAQAQDRLLTGFGR